MSRTRTLACSFAFVLATVAALTTTAAHAVQRTFVASNGSDANTAANCSLAAPCRGFTAAQTVTDNNGEIIVLDSAGYGVVTITKSISISAPAGVYAGISVSTGNTGVTIATAGVKVVLRGISINSLGGSFGIVMSNGAALTVENCIISNFATTNASGIFITTPANVRIIETVFSDNATGVYAQANSSTVVSRSSILGSTAQGVVVYGAVAGTTSAAISRSVISGGNIGVYGLSDVAAANVRVSVSGSTITSNSLGVTSQSSAGAGNAAVTVSDNVITGNFVGLSQGGAATLVTLGNNTVQQNTSANSQGTITSTALF